MLRVVVRLLSQLRCKRVASCLQLIKKASTLLAQQPSQLQQHHPPAPPSLHPSMHPSRLGVIHQGGVASISAPPQGQRSLRSTALRECTGALHFTLTASSTLHPLEPDTNTHTKHKNTHTTSGGPN